MDNEIQILISAVDNISATVKRIEGNLDSMNTKVQKQTEVTSMSFKEAQGNLLLLGQAASSVDNIFDSYENLQLRLENMAIRVEEAQKNQRDAQYNLNKVMNDANSTTEDVAKAQDDLDTATNRVQVALNNQARAGNKVIGTYISMGMNLVVLAGTLPSVITAVWGLVTATWGGVGAFGALTVAGAPVWAIVLAIAAAVAYLIYLWTNWETMSNKVRAVLFLLSPALYALMYVIRILSDNWEYFMNIINGVWELLESFGRWISVVLGPILKPIADMLGFIAGTIGGVFEKVGSVLSVGTKKFNANVVGNKIMVGDAIIRPNGQIIETSPEDTLYATKGGLGNYFTFNIEKISGVDPDDIARAFKKELVQRINI